MIEDTVVKCKILRDDSPEFRRHTGIGYRFVEEEKDQIIVNFNYIKH
jgi:hypothetical protein